MRVRLIQVVFLALAAVVGACTSAPGTEGPTEFLDETTAVTVSVATKPLVFARERAELAAHARDYVTLVGASVNRSGTVDYFMFAYFWSTVDRRDAKVEPPPDGEFTIAADDRRILPHLTGHSTQDAGVGSAVQAPPGHRWSLNVYKTDLATLRYLAESRHLAAITGPEQEPITYDLWEDQRPALRALGLSVRRATPPPLN
jgi:hypothetical protein